MKKKTELIMLDCGISAERWIGGGVERIRVSIIDAYNGYGELNNLKKLSELFAELADKGYEGTGMHTQTGYYDSVDDIFIDVTKQI